MRNAREYGNTCVCPVSQCGFAGRLRIGTVQYGNVVFIDVLIVQQYQVKLLQ